MSVQLMSVLAEYTTDIIVFFQSFPIGDDQNAAFAITWGEVWYVTASGAQVLESGIYGDDDQPCLWTVDGVTIFKCENMGISSTESFAWYIKDGNPVKLSYTGSWLTYMGDGQFVAVGEAYDGLFEDEMWRGHTYKPYYFYWENDGLVEYGGLEITQEQLLEVNGAQAVLDTITNAGYTVDEIYYRANNIINVNYHSCDDESWYYYDNVTLIYKNDSVTPKFVYSYSGGSETESFNEDTLEDFSYGGTYLAARYSQIATYPDIFPVN